MCESLGRPVSYTAAAAAVQRNRWSCICAGDDDDDERENTYNSGPQAERRHRGRESVYLAAVVRPDAATQRESRACRYNRDGMFALRLTSSLFRLARVRSTRSFTLSLTVQLKLKLRACCLIGFSIFANPSKIPDWDVRCMVYMSNSTTSRIGLAAEKLNYCNFGRTLHGPSFLHSSGQ